MYFLSHLLHFPSFIKVRNFPNLLAGNLMLIGQVSDAIFTPFIGFESDRTKGIKGLGKRKTWHLVGEHIALYLNVSYNFKYNSLLSLLDGQKNLLSVLLE